MPSNPLFRRSTGNNCSQYTRAELCKMLNAALSKKKTKIQPVPTRKLSIRAKSIAKALTQKKTTATVAEGLVQFAIVSGELKIFVSSKSRGKNCLSFTKLELQRFAAQHNVSVHMSDIKKDICEKLSRLV